MRLILMAPPEINLQVNKAISSMEVALGLSIRNDLLGIFGDRYLHFVPEPGSTASPGGAFFLSVGDKQKAVENLTKALTGIAELIQSKIGEDGEAFVRIRTIERENFTQIYPQSVLPAMFTPNLTVTDSWLGMGLSARATLERTRLLLEHEKSVMERPDFAALLPKMPKDYYSISYTDVGRCFGKAISLAQFLTDLGVLGLKVVAKQGEMPIPMDITKLWPMDPGRFPKDAVLREKLFGSISVWVREEDGIRYENFSSVGPLPLPTGVSSMGPQNQIATMSILAGMLMPALARARGSARQAACRSNLHGIGNALFDHQTPNRDLFPGSLADLVPAYIDNPALFQCPSDPVPFTIKNGIRCSYRYIGIVPFRKVSADLIIAYDHRPHRNMRNALHFDGHVAAYAEVVFRRKLAEQYAGFQEYMKAPDFPGDKERVAAFFEGRDFAEE